MKERPILFNAEMVRAILDGRKTQTRRVIKPQPPLDGWRPLGVERYHPTKVDRDGEEYAGPEVFGMWDDDSGWVCPYGGPGDRLWVRETWGVCNSLDNVKPYDLPRDVPIVYRASSVHPDDPSTRWRPSIHIPRWASRITLEIVSVRVERVQEISGEDAKGEGINLPCCGCEACGHSATMCPADASAHIEDFAHLWDRINAKRGHPWESNPWVWVIEFRKL